jgi:PilZ domain
MEQEMREERRKTPRQAINRIAKIIVSDDALPRDCLITDISEGGVRLHVEGITVPDQFNLIVRTTPPTRRQCATVWRLGYEVGAEFVVTREANLPRYKDLLTGS